VRRPAKAAGRQIAAMALCVQSEDYSEFASPLANYGANAPYPGPQPSEGSSEPQMTAEAGQQSSAQFWQDEQVEAGLEWQGGMASMSYTGGWGAAQPPFRPLNGQQQQRLKRRFCTSYPEVQLCRRAGACSFAHSREEIRAPLLAIEEERQDADAMTDDFFMYKYKTLWCPIGVQHEWHTCVYAHNYQDARRPVDIGYGARLCPYWSKKDTGAEYSQRCPLGLRCPYAHGAKEQLYHPHYFKTVVCRDLRTKVCPRQGLCAFFHHRNERRSIAGCNSEEIDYCQPLLEEALNNDWVADFLTPPFLPEMTKGNEDGVMTMPDGSNCNFAGHSNDDWMRYGMPQVPHIQAPYGMQQPMVFLMPYPPMSQVPQQGPESPQNGGQVGCPQNGGQLGGPMGNMMCPPGANWVFVPMDANGQMPLQPTMAVAAS
jgi:hypothetical protein